MAWIVMLVLFALFVLVWPVWPYSQVWGYYPSLLIGLVWTVLFVMRVTGAWPR